MGCNKNNQLNNYFLSNESVKISHRRRIRQNNGRLFAHCLWASPNPLRGEGYRTLVSLLRESDSSDRLSFINNLTVLTQ